MSSGWGEQPASESAPEPTDESAEGGDGGGGGGSGGVLVAVLIILVVLLVLGGGAAAFFILRPDRPDPDDDPLPNGPTPVVVSSAAASESSTPPVVTESSTPPVTTRPVNTGLPQISGTAKVGQVLTTSLGTWQDTSGIQFSVVWAACPSTDPLSCAVISGATSATYTVTTADQSQFLISVVRADKAGGETVQVQSAVVGPVLPA